jgi:hypothetical protein
VSQKKDDKGLPHISFEISKELEGGVYVNQAIIIHSRKEFMIDLGLALPNGKIKVQSRVITNPIDAKAIYLALKENIEKYEQQHGVIPLPKPVPKPESKQVH